MDWIEHMTREQRAWVRASLVATLSLLCVAQVSAQDPRVGLRAGYQDAGSAVLHLERIASVPRPDGFSDPTNLGNILFANTDLAFRGNDLFLGNFHGFQIYDISDPAKPKLRTAVVCPGGQGDLSVWGNLLFMSVEMPNGRVDCGTTMPAGMSSAERFRGVRIFDISNLGAPKQVAAVQTCRGSHTHTLVTRPGETERVWVYVAGTSFVRPETELAGCSGGAPEEDPNTALFRIEIIEVPLAAPQNARVVNAPRIFADRSTGAVSGLWPGGAHGEGTQSSARTDQCHDITAYPELGLAAGACSGNGIVLDIRDPANPVRIDEVVDPNFAYWHSATFNNDGTKILFTDEWGGGMAPRCRATDLPQWGANAIFDVVDGKMKLGGYFKIPAPQTASENCVAHNGSLIPVPGRDIMVQAWYQGGLSVLDFTDATKPFEIAYFDRGPLSDTLHLGGHWSAYWYNGRIYASEIARGLDIFELKPSEHLTQNEIEAAKLVRFETFNPQLQPKFTWPAAVSVARAYVDQLKRGNAVSAERSTAITAALDRAERGTSAERQATQTELRSLAAQIEADAARATGPDAKRLNALAQTLNGLASR